MKRFAEWLEERHPDFLAESNNRGRNRRLAALGIVGGTAFWGALGLAATWNWWNKAPTTPVSPPSISRPATPTEAVNDRDPGPFSDAWRQQLFRHVVNQRNYKVIPYDKGWVIIFRTGDKPAAGSAQEETHYREFYQQARRLLQDPGQGNRPARLGRMYLAIDGWEDPRRPGEYSYVYFMPNVK